MSIGMDEKWGSDRVVEPNIELITLSYEGSLWSSFLAPLLLERLAHSKLRGIGTGILHQVQL